VQELGGSRARQSAKLASGNILYHGCPAPFMNGHWPGDRKLSALLVSMNLNPLLSRSSNFSGNSYFLCVMQNSQKCASLVFCDHCLGTGCGSAIEW